jgi:hypothetical protein
MRITMPKKPQTPFERAYIFWYIEMEKPLNERNEDILRKKYKFAGRKYDDG